MQFCSPYSYLFGPYHSTGNSFLGSKKKKSSYSTVARAQIIHYAACIFGHYGVLPEVHLRICHSCLSTHGFTQIESFYMESHGQHNLSTIQKYPNYTFYLAPPWFHHSFYSGNGCFQFRHWDVLSQAGHPIAFFTKKQCLKKQSSSVYVKEMLAIIESVKKWRHYLIGNHFQIITDQQSLRGLLTSACHTPEQQKWASRLIGYNFDILYRPICHNQAADFLSRPPPSVFLAISSQYQSSSPN